MYLQSPKRFHDAHSAKPTDFHCMYGPCTIGSECDKLNCYPLQSLQFICDFAKSDMEVKGTNTTVDGMYKMASDKSQALQINE
jgi:hypothetical protein